jgi:hypothetical protein
MQRGRALLAAENDGGNTLVAVEPGRQRKQVRSLAPKTVKSVPLLRHALFINPDICRQPWRQ